MVGRAGLASIKPRARMMKNHPQRASISENRPGPLACGLDAQVPVAVIRQLDSRNAASLAHSLSLLGEPCQDFIQAGRDPDDCTAMHRNQGLVMTGIGILDRSDRGMPDRVPDPVEAPDEDEPAGQPLTRDRQTLRGRFALHAHACPVPYHVLCWNEQRTCLIPPEVAMQFFEFPEDARWNAERECVEFSVILRPYEGTVRVPKRVFQGLLNQSPTPERCMEAFHVQ